MNFDQCSKLRINESLKEKHENKFFVMHEKIKMFFSKKNRKQITLKIPWVAESLPFEQTNKNIRTLSENKTKLIFLGRLSYEKPGQRFQE